MIIYNIILPNCIQSKSISQRANLHKLTDTLELKSMHL